MADAVVRVVNNRAVVTGGGPELLSVLFSRLAAIRLELLAAIEAGGGDAAGAIAALGEELEATAAALDGAKADKTIEVTGSGLATGGGALDGDRQIAVPRATTDQALASTSDDVAMTPKTTGEVVGIEADIRAEATQYQERISAHPSIFRGLAGVDMPDGSVAVLLWLDQDGVLRDPQGAVRTYLNEAATGDLIQAVTLSSAGLDYLVGGYRRADGFTYAQGLAGPVTNQFAAQAVEAVTSDWAWYAPSRLADGSDGGPLLGVGRDGKFYAPGRSDIGVSISPDDGQVYAVSPTLFERISWLGVPVTQASVAQPPSTSEIVVRATAHRIGGADLTLRYTEASFPALVAADGTMRMQIEDGQSNGVSYSRVAYTTVPPSPDVLMFSDNAVNPGTYGVSLNASGGTVASRTGFLVPAREMTRSNGYGETRCTLGGFLHWRQALKGAAPVVVTNLGAGGQPYANLKKGTAHYANIITAVTAFVERAEERSLSPIVEDVTFCQGENDTASLLGVYSGNLDEYSTDLNTDIKPITGQSADVWLYVDQMGDSEIYAGEGYARVSNVALDQLDRGRLNPLIVCVGPKYWCEFHPDDKVHLSALDQMQLGGYYARARRQRTLFGTKRLPLHVVEPPSVQGRYVELVFSNKPSEPLVLDRNAVAAIAGAGVTARQAGGLIAVADVEVSGFNRVAIELAATPAAGALNIGVAYEGGGVQGRETGHRSNIRTESRDINPFTGRPLHDWACHQRITVA